MSGAILARISWSTFAAAIAVLGSPTSSAAAERELSVGGTLNYLYFDQGNRFDALSVTAEAHYGLTDAFDLSAAVTWAINPGQNQWGIEPEIGIGYLVDITRFLPRIGLRVGMADIITTSCPAEVNADGSPAPPTPPCGHELHPLIAVPASLDYRLTSAFSLGAHFRYAWLLFGDPANEASIGAYAGAVF